MIKVPDKVILDGKLSSTNRYTFNLYVKDPIGTHLLFTSDFISSSFLTDQQGTFVWSSTFNNTNVSISGDWE